MYIMLHLENLTFDKIEPYTCMRGQDRDGTRVQGNVAHISMNIRHSRGAASLD